MAARTYTKRKMLEAFATYEPELKTWAMTGITLEVLEFLSQKEFKSLDDLNRAHLYARIQRGVDMFGLDASMTGASTYFSEKYATVPAKAIERASERSC